MTLPQAFDLALQHHGAGRLAQAEALYRQILAVQPTHADALHHLGLIAQARRHDLALEWIHKAILLDPNHPATHSNLGEINRALGRMDEAIANYRRAIELQPGYPEAHNNLSAALRERGQLEDAVSEARHALALKPGYPEAHNNLANALREQGQLDDAIAEYRLALAIKPGYAGACNNLSVVLRERGQIAEAIAAGRLALELQPGYPEAWNNLGNALRDGGQLSESIAAYRQAIAGKPSYPDAFTNLGAALAEQGHLDEALAAYRRALDLQADAQEVHNNLGNALRDRGEHDEAIAAYRRAMALKPGHARSYSNLIYTLHFYPGEAGPAIAMERQRWNQQFGKPPQRPAPPHANDRDPERPLRIGYVSPDFRDHVVGRNLIPLFKHHDLQNFEVICYSGAVRRDGLTEEFRSRAMAWRDTAGVGDEALADAIRQDRVDILVDLSQHMAGNRLPMFAHKPAPIQISFAGYPESTGSEAIAYRITDRYLGAAPTDAPLAGKEQLCFIDSFWCYDPCGDDVEVSALPAGVSGRITFGCLANFCKVNDQALKLWARVLARTPASRLILLSRMGNHRQRTLEILEREGIASGRVEFVDHRPRREYLELYQRLDIVLDTFPYNGHTTSLDALWMGVPVVSLAGETPVSHAGLSQLTNLGLPELAARSEAEYLHTADTLARDLPRLAQLRSTLRDRMKQSVLMDAPRFARQIEQAYREMWRAWGKDEV